MSGFDNFNTDFYQTSYSIDDQAQSYGGDYAGGTYNKQYAGYDYSQQGGYVPPEMMQPQQPYTGQIFQPTQTYTPSSPQSFYGSNFEDEPPLLEELGINFDHIWQKTLTVLHPLKAADGSIMNETDMAGPMVFCLAFGATLLLVRCTHMGVEGINLKYVGQKQKLQVKAFLVGVVSYMYKYIMRLFEMQKKNTRVIFVCAYFKNIIALQRQCGEYA
ncbi:Uncharacterized protein PODLI_1B018292 [Podarcis lilfordi]|uniref:Yip1 domain family member 5 n=1 Tax=Podarcis lilfordi TaxID=74358 RepID=A0AA35NW97_9SAUR|nr:Uncharacterized protein PODLI_1B018292 [Podarcis lilfordi]